MTIYVDVLCLLNFALNFLLLLGTAQLTGCPISLQRILSGAALGGVYAACSVVPELGFLQQPLMKPVIMILMCLTAFGMSRNMTKQVVVFLALSFVLCGAVTAVVLLTRSGMVLVGGTAYYPVSAGSLVFTCAGVYLAAWLLLGRLTLHTGGELIPVVLQLGEKQMRIQALRDTGNTLKDPLSNQPVMVADWCVLEALLPDVLRGKVNQSALRSPAALLEQFGYAAPDVRCRLIPYRAIGTSAGLLFAVRCDRLELSGQPAYSRLVAFSPTPVSDGGGYLALTGGI